MTTIGTPLTPKATKVMMLGSGELGKEVVIELQRLGVEVIAVDRYANAPAQQVAHRAYTISMLDGEALKALVEKEKARLHRARSGSDCDGNARGIRAGRVYCDSNGESNPINHES